MAVTLPVKGEAMFKWPRVRVRVLWGDESECTRPHVTGHIPVIEMRSEHNEYPEYQTELNKLEFTESGNTIMHFTMHIKAHGVYEAYTYRIGIFRGSRFYFMRKIDGVLVRHPRRVESGDIIDYTINWDNKIDA